MTSFVFDSAIADALNGAINFEAERFKVLLVTSAYAPDLAHTKRSDIAADTVAAGGMDIAVSLVAKAPARTDIILRGATWPASTTAARGAIFYQSRGGPPSGDRLVAYVDFGVNIVSTAGNFVLTDSTLELRPKFFGKARCVVACEGTDDIELGSAVPGFLTFAEAGFEDEDVVTFGVGGAGGIEIGNGVYRNDAGREWIACDAVFYSSTGAPIAFSAGDHVYVEMPMAGDKVCEALGPELPASLSDFLAEIENDADPVDEILDVFLGAA